MVFAVHRDASGRKVVHVVTTTGDDLYVYTDETMGKGNLLVLRKSKYSYDGFSAWEMVEGVA